jgi:hypothetical protein
LELVKTQTIGTAVTSVTVTGAFNSTYDNYKVIISGSNASVDGTGMRMTLGGSGGSTYFWAGNTQIYDGTNSFQGSNNTTSFQIANTNIVSTTTVVIDFFLPFASQATTYKSIFTGRTSAGQYGGVDNNAISHTSFGFFPSSGNLSGGTIRVYGYRNA